MLKILLSSAACIAIAACTSQSLPRHEPRIIDEVTMPDLPPMHVDNGWLRDGAAPQEVQK